MIQSLTTNIICRVFFQARLFNSKDDLAKVKEINNRYRSLLQWCHPSNFIPGYKWIPSNYTQDVQNSVQEREDFLLEKLDEFKKRYMERNASEVTSLIGMFLEEIDESSENGLSGQDLTTVVYDIIFAATEALYMPMIWTMNYLLHHKMIQEQLHEVLDKVIVGEGCAKLEHKTQLAYVDAILCEVLRHSDLTATGIPRKTSQDTNVGGYGIPANTLVVINVRSIHYDERHWDRPEEFNPERFLDKDGHLRKVNELSYFPFSGGARSCVGQQLAKTGLFLVCANLFLRLNISAVPGENLPSLLGKPGINCALDSFRVNVSRRKATNP